VFQPIIDLVIQTHTLPSFPFFLPCIMLFRPHILRLLMILLFDLVLRIQRLTRKDPEQPFQPLHLAT
jgi:hypothetical protein